jgi:anti-sigma B factor antagonist
MGRNARNGGTEMEINRANHDASVVVAVKGRLDAVSSPEFDRLLAGFLEEGDKDFVIDFGALDYISSAGLRSVLLAAKKLKAKGRRLSLAALKDVVKEVFDIAGFSTIIAIYPSAQAALNDL